MSNFTPGCCTNAVESNVVTVRYCRRHGYQATLKIGHKREELPTEFDRIEAAMRRALVVDRPLFAAMWQMSERMTA